MKVEMKWFQDERGFGFIGYKTNGEVVIYLFSSSEEKNLTKTSEVVKINFVQSKSGYIVKENWWFFFVLKNTPKSVFFYVINNFF